MPVSPLVRRTLIGVALGIVVYVASIAYFGYDELRESLRSVDSWAIVAALALSSFNYGFRFLKWELCLSWLGVRGNQPEQAAELGVGHSILIYLAGLSMSVTPGKIGEVLRSSLLRASHGVPFTRTAPIVFADRLTDLLALIILALIGISSHREFLIYVLGALFLVAAGVIVLGSPTLFGGLLGLVGRVPGLAGLAAKASGMVGASAQLLALRPLAVLTVLSVIGWGLECVGYWMVLEAFPGVSARVATCAFLWATTTLVGALSFMPGGLLATEYTLGLLAVTLVAGLTTTSSAAATLIIRLCTLWYGTAVGALCLGWLMRDPKMRRPLDENPVSPPS